MPLMQKIEPCLWFDSNAEEAARFYVSIFKNSKILHTSYFSKAGAEASGQPEGSILTVRFRLDGYELTGLNGGPIFKPNPSISFIVYCDDVDELYGKLSHNGEIMMALDKYDWNERYAFIKDRFGISWQLMKSDRRGIVPSLLFVGKSLGHAEEAVRYYTGIFKGEIGSLMHQEGKDLVLFSSFTLNGQEFAAMDGEGPHQFGFNEGVSFAVKCLDQAEIDYFWQMSARKDAEQCGWLKDKFGVSWQIIPAEMDKLLAGPGGEKVMAAMLKMHKIDIAELTNAAHSP
jgi:predicted 3-demethylubiquinone-9 3-methyltransferase (glyoxalase superfamily)